MGAYDDYESRYFNHTLPKVERAGERKIMSYQEKDQAGTLFKNDRKRRDSQPDWTGKAIVNGTPIYVSGWDKSGRISLAFKNRQEGGFERKPDDESEREARPRGHPAGDDDGDMPF